LTCALEPIRADGPPFGLSRFAPLKSRVTNIANNGIPLTITGTASNPTIRANLKAMLK